MDIRCGLFLPHSILSFEVQLYEWTVCLTSITAWEDIWEDLFNYTTKCTRIYWLQIRAVFFPLPTIRQISFVQIRTGHTICLIRLTVVFKQPSLSRENIFLLPDWRVHHLKNWSSELRTSTFVLTIPLF